MDTTIILTVQAALAFVCWLVVAGLSAVSITAAGTAWRVMERGWTTDGGDAMAVAMAGYVVAVAIKHVRGEHAHEEGAR